MPIIDLTKTAGVELTAEALRDAARKAGDGGAVVLPVGALWNLALDNEMANGPRAVRREQAIFAFVEQTLRMAVHLTGGQALLSAPLNDEQIRRLVRAGRVAYDEIDNPSVAPADPGASADTEEEDEES